MTFITYIIKYLKTSLTFITLFFTFLLSFSLLHYDPQLVFKNVLAVEHKDFDSNPEDFIINCPLPFISECNGTSGNDIIIGTSGSDLIFGEEGNDLVQGGLLTDEIHGGEGDDTLQGGEGSDIIYGEDGNDYLFADSPNSAISFLSPEL